MKEKLQDIKNKLAYYMVRGAIASFSLLPFCVLYFISDMLYFLVRYVVRYRRKVVRENLANSFPEKSDDERKTIEKQFYHHFCDMLMEWVKTYRMSYDDILKHVEFENRDAMANLIKEGRNMMFASSHKGNWEWMPALYWQLDCPNLVGVEVNRPAKNPYINNFLKSIRNRLGMELVDKNDIIRPLIKYRKGEKTFGLGLLADQTPSIKNIDYWTEFLHQDTPFLSGPERMARMFKSAYVYADVVRIKRGYYKYRLTVLSVNVAEEEEYAATEKYARLLEKSIQEYPSDWLWTHRRWKHKRENAKC